MRGGVAHTLNRLASIAAVVLAAAGASAGEVSLRPERLSEGPALTAPVDRDIVLLVEGRDLPLATSRFAVELLFPGDAVEVASVWTADVGAAPAELAGAGRLRLAIERRGALLGRPLPDGALAVVRFRVSGARESAGTYRALAFSLDGLALDGVPGAAPLGQGAVEVAVTSVLGDGDRDGAVTKADFDALEALVTGAAPEPISRHADRLDVARIPAGAPAGTVDALDANALSERLCGRRGLETALARDAVEVALRSADGLAYRIPLEKDPAAAPVFSVAHPCFEIGADGVLRNVRQLPTGRYDVPVTIATADPLRPEAEPDVRTFTFKLDVAPSFGAPVGLAYVAPPPSRAVAGEAIALEVALVDANGYVVTTYNGEVALTLASDPESGLSGYTTVRARHGVAVFEEVEVDEAGEAERLVAVAPGYAAAESGLIAVDAVPAPKPEPTTFYALRPERPGHGDAARVPVDRDVVLLVEARGIPKDASRFEAEVIFPEEDAALLEVRAADLGVVPPEAGPGSVRVRVTKEGALRARPLPDGALAVLRFRVKGDAAERATYGLLHFGLRTVALDGAPVPLDEVVQASAGITVIPSFGDGNHDGETDARDVAAARDALLGRPAGENAVERLDVIPEVDGADGGGGPVDALDIAALDRRACGYRSIPPRPAPEEIRVALRSADAFAYRVPLERDPRTTLEYSVDHESFEVAPDGVLRNRVQLATGTFPVTVKVRAADPLAPAEAPYETSVRFLFEVTPSFGAPVGFVFTPIEPSGGAGGGVSFEVHLVDADGYVITTFDGDVSLDLASDSPNSSLSGYTTAPARDGVATFENVVVRGSEGDTHAIVASAPGYSGASEPVAPGAPPPAPLTTEYGLKVERPDAPRASALSIDRDIVLLVTARGIDRGASLLEGDLLFPDDQVALLEVRTADLGVVEPDIVLPGTLRLSIGRRGALRVRPLPDGVVAIARFRVSGDRSDPATYGLLKFGLEEVRLDGLPVPAEQVSAGSAEVTVTTILGDANRDGAVDGADLDLAQRLLVGSEVTGAPALERLDVIAPGPGEGAAPPRAAEGVDAVDTSAIGRRTCDLRSFPVRLGALRAAATLGSADLFAYRVPLEKDADAAPVYDVDDPSFVVDPDGVVRNRRHLPVGTYTVTVTITTPDPRAPTSEPQTETFALDLVVHPSFGAPAALAFTVPPADEVAGRPFRPALEVSVVDAEGLTVTTAGDLVSLAIGANPTVDAPLLGETQAAADVGVAIFADLFIERAGAGYTLLASAPGLADAVSDPFTIVPAEAEQLVFTVSPGPSFVGSPLSPDPAVAVADRYGNPVPSAIDEVTVALGENRGGAGLWGETTAPALGGAASFPDLNIDTAGYGYTMVGTAAGLRPATSLPFDVEGWRDGGDFFLSDDGCISSIEAIDLGTGIDSLVVTDGCTDEIIVLTGTIDENGNTVFTPTRYPNQGCGAGEVVAADFSGDGQVEFAVLSQGCGDDDPGNVTVWRNNGDGTFTPNPPIVLTTDRFCCLKPKIEALTLAGVGTVLATMCPKEIRLAIDGMDVAVIPWPLPPIRYPMSDPRYSEDFPCGVPTYKVFVSDGVLTILDCAGLVHAYDVWPDGTVVERAATTFPPPDGACDPVCEPDCLLCSEDTFHDGKTQQLLRYGNSVHILSELAGREGSPCEVVSESFPSGFRASAKPESLEFDQAVQAGARILFECRDLDGGDHELIVKAGPEIGVFRRAIGSRVVRCTGAADRTERALGFGCQSMISANEIGRAIETSSDPDAMNKVRLDWMDIERPGHARDAVVDLVISINTTPQGHTQPVTTTEEWVGRREGGCLVYERFRSTRVTPPCDTVIGIVYLSNNCRVITCANGRVVTECLPECDYRNVAGTATRLSARQVTAGEPFSVEHFVYEEMPAFTNPGRLATNVDTAFSVAIAVNAGGGSMIGATQGRIGDGYGRIDGVKIDKAGYGYKIQGRACTGSTAADLNVLPAAPHKLAFRGRPPDVKAGDRFSVQVEVQDYYGNHNPNATSWVTLSIANPDGYSVTLSGPKQVQAVGGVATFSGIWIDRARTGWALRAVSGGLEERTSEGFTVSPAWADHMVFTAIPTGCQLAGQGFRASVELRDRFSNTATWDTRAVTLRLGENPRGGSLSGALTQTSANGFAHFDVSIGTPAPGYTLVASSSFTALEPGGNTPSGASAAASAESPGFDIRARCCPWLEVAQQPGNATAGEPNAQPLTVIVRNVFGDHDTSRTDAIRVQVSGSPWHGGATTVAASGGVATFSELEIYKAGCYTLSVDVPAEPCIGGATSAEHCILPAAPAALDFVRHPNHVSGCDLLRAADGGVAVRVEDVYGNHVPGATHTIGLALQARPGAGELVGTTTRAASGGVATFGDLRVYDASGTYTGDGYTLIAYEAGGLLAPVVSGHFNVGPCAPCTTTFVDGPTSERTTEEPILARVMIRDVHGNRTPRGDVDVTLSVGTNPHGGVIGGQTSVRASGGYATFGGFTLDEAGRGYTVVASVGGAQAGCSASGVSAPFNVKNPCAPDPWLAFIGEPHGARAGESAGDVVVELRDVYGDRLTTHGAGTVALGFAANPGGARFVTAVDPATVIHGPLFATLVAGVAVFPAVKLERTGKDFTLRAALSGACDAVSEPFTITPNDGTQLAFLNQPASRLENEAFGVNVGVLDVFGNLTAEARDVLLAIAQDPGHGGSLSGGGTVRSSNGISGYTLGIDRAGRAYRLGATSSGLRGATSEPFHIYHPCRGTTTVQWYVDLVAAPPSQVTAETPFTIAVALKNEFGEVQDVARPVTIRLSESPAGGTLRRDGGGAFTLTTEGGVATFDGLWIDVPADGYRIQVTDGSDFPCYGETARLDVKPIRLEFTQEPHGPTRAGENVGPLTVRMVDIHGNLVTRGGHTASLSIGDDPGGGAIGGTTSRPLVDGVASFDFVTVSKTGSPYTIDASSPLMTTGRSAGFEIVPNVPASARFEPGPRSWVLANQPMPASDGGAVKVRLYDAYGPNLCTDQGGTITVTKLSGPAGTLSGETSGAVSGGIASFPNLRLDVPGPAYRLHARWSGNAAVVGDSDAFDNRLREREYLEWVTQPATTRADRAIATVRVGLYDVFGSIDARRGDRVTMSLAQNPAAGALGGTTAVYAAQGIATFEDLRICKAGAGYALKASAAAPTIPPNLPLLDATGDSATFSMVPGDPVKLAFVTEPTTAKACDPNPSAIAVAIQDACDNTVPEASDAIVLTLAANPAGVALSGALSGSTSGGVATFPDVRIDRAGSPYRLLASGGKYGTATSAGFAVQNNVPVTMTIAEQPGTVLEKTTARFTVVLRDCAGNECVDAGTDVALSVGSNPHGGKLTVGQEAPVPGGRRRFAFSLDEAGCGYTVVASAAGVESATSAPFDVHHPTEPWIKVSTQPHDALAGNPIGPVAADVVDRCGDRVTSSHPRLSRFADARVTASIGRNAAGSGRLSGGLVRAAVEGRAAFDDIWIDLVGIDYTLVFSAPSVEARESGKLRIYANAPVKLCVLGQPGAGFADQPIAPEVAIGVCDRWGNVVSAANTIDKSGATHPVSIALEPHPRGGVLYGTTSAAASDGVARFGALRIDRPGAGYRLVATSPGLQNCANQAAGEVSAPFDQWKCNPPCIRFDAAPEATPAGDVIAPPIVVAVEDVFGDVDPGFSGDVTLSWEGPWDPVLRGTLTVKAASGVATFADISAERAGTGYRFTAAAAGRQTGASASFRVSSANPARVCFRAEAQPHLALVGEGIGPVQTVIQDRFGNEVTPANGRPGISNPVTVTIARNAGGGALAGTATVASVDGIATFGDLRIVAPAGGNVSAPGYSLACASPTLYSCGESALFDIWLFPRPRLETLVHPVGAKACQPIGTFKVQRLNVYGRVEGSGHGVSVSLDGSPAGVTLGGSKSATISSGYLSFTSLAVNKRGSGYVVRADASGHDAAFSAPFDIDYGLPDHLTFVSSPHDAVAGTDIGGVTVAIRDCGDNDIPAKAGELRPVTLAVHRNPGGGALLGTTTVYADAAGVARFSGLRIERSGECTTLLASGAGLTAETGCFTITPDAPHEAFFVTDPPATIAGERMSPAPRVLVRDRYGNACHNAGCTLTLSVEPNPTGAALAGALTVGQSGGVYGWGDLSMTVASGGYGLVARGCGLEARSNPFAILPADPVSVDFVGQPADGRTCDPFPSAVRVALRDRFGNIASRADPDRYAIDVELAYNAFGGALGGTLRRPATGGVASFADLSLGVIGEYTLLARSIGLPAPEDDDVVIWPPDVIQNGEPPPPTIEPQRAHAKSRLFRMEANTPVALRFLKGYQPQDTVERSQMPGLVGVAVVDKCGNIVVADARKVTLSLGKNPGPGALTGLLEQPAVDGRALFKGLIVSTAGSGYTLVAKASGLTQAESEGFDVTPLSASVPIIVACKPFASATGDLNNDGGVDMAVVSAACDNVSILINLRDGTGQLAQTGDYATGRTPSAVAVGYLDGDANLDIAVANNRSNNITVLLGNGMGIFRLGMFLGAQGAGPSGIAIGDVNLDGLGDIIVTNFNSGNAKVFAGFGTGKKFALLQTVTTGAGPIAIATRDFSQPLKGHVDLPDFDKDGRPDLAIPNRGAKTVTVALGNGAGFDLGTEYKLPATPSSITVGNFNEDGHLDIAVAAGNGVCILFGNGLGQFAAPECFPVSGNDDAIVLAVPDAEGNDTIFVGSPTSTTATILPRDPDGGFGEPIEVVTGGGVGGGVVGDFTGEGTAGVVLTSEETSSLIPMLPGSGAPEAGRAIAFSAAPLDGIAGAALRAITVAVQDEAGALVAEGTKAITLALLGGPEGAQLLGTRQVLSVGGYASFEGLSVDRPGEYRIVASTDGYEAVTSAVFRVTGAPAALRFTVEPADAIASEELAAVEVALADERGSVVTAAPPTSISLRLAGGADALSGPLSALTSDGVARFAGLSIDAAGTYALLASGNAVPEAASRAFTVHAAGAAAIAFVGLPASVGAGESLAGFGVAVVDAFGNTVPGASAHVTVAIAQNPGGAQLFGITEADTVSGFAALPVSLDRAAAGYTLLAAAAGFDPVMSAPFAVLGGAPAALEFEAAPSSGVAGEVLAPLTVVLEDAFGNRASGDERTITLSLADGGALGGTTALLSAQGAATFGDLTIAAAGEAHVLAAASPGIVGARSEPFSVVAARAEDLRFVLQPADAPVGDPLPVEVAVEDEFGNPVLDAALEVTVFLGEGPGTLRGTRKVVTLGGVARFGELSVNQVGGPYRLIASAAGLGSVTSEPFSALAPAPRRLAFAVGPRTTAAGKPLDPPIQVTVTDSLGVRVAGAAHEVTLALAPNAAGASLSGATVASAADGVAVFPGLSVDRAAQGLRIVASAAGLADGTSAAFDSTLFVDPVPVPVDLGGAAGPSTSGDVNGDGISDTIAIDLASGTVVVLVGDASGALSPSITITIGVDIELTAVAVADLDGDGDLDVVVTGADGNVYVSTGDGAGGFSAPVPFPSGGASGVPGSIAIGDVNGDGVPDIVIAGPESGTVTILPGLPAGEGGGYGAPVTVVVGGDGISDVALVDLDGDGDLDIVAARPADGGVSIVNGGGDGSFTSGGLIPTGDGPVTIAVGDVNGDGAPDVVVGNAGSGDVTVLLGDGQGGFTVGPTLPAGTDPSDVVLVDADGDGDLDIVVSVDGGVAILPGSGDGGFGPATTYPQPGGGGTIAVGDFDGDGEPDIVTTGPGGTTVLYSDGGDILRLVFVADPSSVEAGAALPSIRVHVVDAEGNLVASATPRVTIVLGSGEALATVEAVGGVATFSGLVLEEAGTDLHLTVSADGLIGAQSATFSVTPSAPYVVIVTSAPGSVVAGEPFTVTVEVRDRFGNLVTDADPVTIAVAVPGATLSGTTTLTPEGGVATFEGLSVDVAGSLSFTVSTPGVPGATTPALTVEAGPAAQLAIAEAPAGAVAGAPVEVRVEVRDASGNLVTGGSYEVTLEVRGPDGSLVATLTGWTEGGVATFPGVEVDAAGGFTIGASTPGLAPASGAPIAVSAAAPAALTFESAPALAPAAAPFEVTVAVRDELGNLVTDASTPVTLALSGGAAEVALLHGTTTVVPVGGIATFTDLRVDDVGLGYLLVASAPGIELPAASGTFAVEPGAPAALVFTSGPSDAVAGFSFEVAVRVTVVDAAGNTVTGFTGTVTVEVRDAGGAVVRTVAVPASGGTAVFADLAVTGAGAGYTLTASAGGLAPLESAPFAVAAAAPARVEIVGQPASFTAGGTFGASARIVDTFGNLVPGAAHAVTVSLSTNPGGGALAGTLTVGASGGLVSWTDLSLTAAGEGYSLIARADGLAPATTASFDVAPGAGDRIVFSVEPTDVVAGEAVGPAVRVSILDAHGNVALASSDAVAIALGANPNAPREVPLLGTLEVAAAAGVATFGDLSIETTGAGYTLVASWSGRTATSRAFRVWPAPSDHIAFTKQPAPSWLYAPLVSDPLAGAPIEVGVFDRFGNLTSEGEAITITLGVNPGARGLTGGAAKGTQGGLVSFANLRVDGNGLGFTLHADAVLRERPARAESEPFTVRSFVPPASFALGSGPQAVAAADLDGDGDRDLALAEVEKDRVAVLLGDGAGAFTPGPTLALAPASFPVALLAQDLDGDGKADLAVACGSANRVALLRGLGGGAFAAPVYTYAGVRPASLAAADVDGDGETDLAVANFEQGTVSVLHGSRDAGGAYRLGGERQYAAGSGGRAMPSAVAIGDVTGDGRRDLVVANHGDGAIAVLAGKAEGGFAAPVAYGEAVLERPVAIALAELAGAGLPSIVVADLTGAAAVFRNDGSAGWLAGPARYALGAASAPASVAIADLDLDGRLDIALADHLADGVRILAGEAGGAFALREINELEHPPTDGVVLPVSIVAAELDGDGKADLAVASAGRAQVSVLRTRYGP